ncbi:hypothetical protein [Tsukamurella soli]|uniref:Uncharacterized protein n=1 Tax=Tsukamurella soli TaxID=644556 RepID=A0ABP8KHV3_9ACTN
MPVELQLLGPAREPLDLLDGLVVAEPPEALQLHRFDGDVVALAEFLVWGVHDEGPGFAVAVDDGDAALAVLAGTVAALTGFDIPAAIAAPDVARLAGLNPMARDAVRERLRYLVASRPADVDARLRHFLG